MLAEMADIVLAAEVGEVESHLKQVAQVALMVLLVATLLEEAEKLHHIQER